MADSESVYDLLTVALVRRAQYGMLAEVGTVHYSAFLHEAFTVAPLACLLTAHSGVWPFPSYCEPHYESEAKCKVSIHTQTRLIFI